MEEYKEMVKYANPLNKMPLWNLTKNEVIILFTILSKLKNKGGQLVELSFNELKEYVVANSTTAEMSDYLNKILLKIGNVPIRIETKSIISAFWIFQEFQINKDLENLTVSITPRFFYFLNDFGKDNLFTTFELAEFSMLSTKSQILYRLLKQFKYTGVLKIDWVELKNLLGLENYANRDISKILDNCISELNEINLFNKTPIFKNLTYTKEYFKKRGRPIKSIEFTFFPEPRASKTVENPKGDHAERIAKSVRKEKIIKRIQNDKKMANEQWAKDNAKQQYTKNPLTGEDTDEMQAYLYQHFDIKNKKFGGYDRCKILDIKKENGKVIAFCKNMENEKKFPMEFESLTHLKNALRLK